MRVIHYTRNAESDFHMHAGSYASCFFVPDEQIVIFSEQHGSFGGVTYSLTDREEMIREGQLIADGEIPDMDMVSFSDIHDFDYDDGKIRGLIEDAKSAKELDERTKAGIEQLLEAAKSDEVEKEREYLSTNPTTLDPATLGRLEGLVARIDNDHFKESFYGKLKSTTGTPEEREQQVLEEFRQVSNYADPSRLLTKFRSIEEGSLDDASRSELLEIVYKTAQNGRKYDVMREIGAELGKDENQVEAEITSKRIEKLEEVMLVEWELRGEEREGTHYVPAVKRTAKDIPDERVYETARKVYEALRFRGDAQYRGNFDDAQNSIKAALLAKEYLGDEKFLEAGKGVVKSILEARPDWNRNKEYYGAVDSLELPDEIAHPVMLYFFNISLANHSMDPVAIAMKHNLTDDEIRGTVNESYGQFIQQGYVQGALRMRELFDDFVEDKNIPVDDLRTLIGVMNYRQDA